MSKITIIEGNSNDKDQVRNYMVKGEPGNDGVSPSASVTRGTGKATINVTDAEGTTSSDVFDGVSPTVEISKTSGVTTITITDAEGTHTATINDGADGATTNIIDSETLSDNTTQTYSGRIIDEKLGDISVPQVTRLTSIWDSNTTSFEFDLPTGYTLSNFTVLNIYLGDNNSMIYDMGSDGFIIPERWYINSDGKLEVQLFSSTGTIPQFTNTNYVYVDILKY